MHLDDRITIETPEGVSIDVTLAGLGSRFGAAVVDVFIQFVLLLAVTLVLSLAGSSVSADLAVFLFGIGTLAVAAIILGYYLVFETLNGGRTPGKAAFGIRVATVDGGPLTFGAVTLRNLMRLVDFLPVAYAVGSIAMVTTSRNQRLGDLVAGTVVVRDRVASTPGPPTAAPAEAEGWDVSAVSDEELALVRRFVARSSGLAPEARERLAADLAARLRPRVAGGEDLEDAEFLAQLVVEKQAR